MSRKIIVHSLYKYDGRWSGVTGMGVKMRCACVEGWKEHNQHKIQLQFVKIPGIHKLNFEFFLF